jgi:hypothetical protein
LGVHWQPMFDLIQIFCHEVWATCSWLRHAAPNNCKVPEGKRQCTIYLLLITL